MTMPSDPHEHDRVRIDRGNEPGAFTGVVERVRETRHGGAMLVRCIESTAPKAHVDKLYSVGLETADWDFVDDSAGCGADKSTSLGGCIDE